MVMRQREVLLTADKLKALGWAPQINMKEGYQLLMDYLAQEN